MTTKIAAALGGADVILTEVQLPKDLTFIAI
jgi:hypothetical protein